MRAVLQRSRRRPGCANGGCETCQCGHTTGCGNYATGSAGHLGHRAPSRSAWWEQALRILNGEDLAVGRGTAVCRASRPAEAVPRSSCGLGRALRRCRRNTAGRTAAAGLQARRTTACGLVVGQGALRASDRFYVAAEGHREHAPLDVVSPAGCESRGGAADNRRARWRRRPPRTHVTL